MKKITFILAFLFISLMSNAQVLMSESFDSALDWTSAHVSGTSTLVGWSRVTTGVSPTCSPFAGAGMAKFDSYDVPASNGYSLTSPAVTFDGNPYRLTFKMYRDSGDTSSDKIRIYINTTATSTGGTLLGTVFRATNLTPVVTSDGWYSYTYDIPAGTTGVRYISFLANSAYGDNMYIDEVSINQVVNNDAQMTSINFAPIISTLGNNTVSGVITNNGLNDINSFDVSWQVGNGTVYTQSFTGLTITPGQTYNYSLPDQWNAQPGLYSMSVWVSNTNGGDNNPANNQITQSIAVASNSAARLPLYEKFSSSTCSPCASFNTTYFNPFYATNSSNLALINYQMNWPGTGDPYYTAEGGTRRAYYGVNAIPDLFIDSKDATTSSSTALQNNLNNEIIKPAFFTINATKNLVGQNMSVDITTTPYLTGTSYRLYAAVVERITTGNISSNGETSFHNVMMKMMPDASGTILACVHDVPITTSLQVSLTGTNVEDYTNLDVVVFVQDYNTKAIMQASYAVDLLSNSQFNNAASVSLYPNPTNGIVKINTTSPVNIVVSDVSGKVVYSSNQITNQSTLDLSLLQKGIYFAKISGDNTDQTQKIILK